MKSLGFIEISGVTAAMDALDIMSKSANVELVTWERKMGGRLVTIIVTGDVSAVTAAVSAEFPPLRALRSWNTYTMQRITISAMITR